MRVVTAMRSHFCKRGAQRRQENFIDGHPAPYRRRENTTNESVRGFQDVKLPPFARISQLGETVDVTQPEITPYCLKESRGEVTPPVVAPHHAGIIRRVNNKRLLVPGWHPIVSVQDAPKKKATRSKVSDEVAVDRDKVVRAATRVISNQPSHWMMRLCRKSPVDLIGDRPPKRLES
jgi:hypothetical protein